MHRNWGGNRGSTKGRTFNLFYSDICIETDSKSRGRLDLAVLFTPVLAYAGELYLPRWCRQNSHVTCSKTRWQSTVNTVVRYFLSFPIGSDNYSYRKTWSLVKWIERTCILSFIFLLLGNRIGLFFHNSNSNRLIYSRKLQSAQFSLF